MTNDLAIANELAHHDNVQLTMLGGTAINLFVCDLVALRRNIDPR